MYRLWQQFREDGKVASAVAASAWPDRQPVLLDELREPVEGCAPVEVKL